MHSSSPAVSSALPSRLRRVAIGLFLEHVLPALLGALSLVSPCDCAGCGAADIELCAACREKLRARPLESVLPDGTRLVSAHAYEGVVRDTVLAFKQQGRFRLGKQLGRALRAAVDLCVDEAEAVAASVAASVPVSVPVQVPRPAGDRPSRSAGGGAIALAAVPSSPAGRRRRGYEPVALLLQATDARPWPHALKLARASGTQKSRGRSARLASRVGSMRADPRLNGVRVLIVDDVVTSGGTVIEAARALREVGAEVVGACCLAATPLISEGVR